jgi:hypothetical protein
MNGGIDFFDDWKKEFAYSRLQSRSRAARFFSINIPKQVILKKSDTY